MRSNTTHEQRQARESVSHNEHLLVRALIFFAIAWFFLTVGVFTFYPLSIMGLLSLLLGLLGLLSSQTYFVRYARHSRKTREQIQHMQQQQDAS